MSLHSESVATATSNTSPRAKHWCFTLNNHSEEDLARLEALYSPDGSSEITYLIYGKEIGDSGTPHLQGFVSFNTRKRLSQAVGLIGQAHFSIARNVSHSVEYCKKDGDWKDYGIPPRLNSNGSTSGIRVDLEAFKADVRSGSVKSAKEARELHSETYARYTRFCIEYIDDQQETAAIETFPLRKWQARVAERLKLPADTRSIVFIVDVIGNSGKSWFCHYMQGALPDGDVQVLLPGKKADMAYVLDSGIRVLFLDAPRSKQGEFIQYDFLEDVKNGYVLAPKYESRFKRLGKVHIIVMMNEMPDVTKISEDRLVIYDLTPSDLELAGAQELPL